MNTTYLIGNGFDLNLGLDTRYLNFYDYYKKQEPKSELIKKFKNDLCNNYDIWADLESALGKYTHNYSSIDDFIKIYYDIYDNLFEFIKEEDNKFTVDSINEKILKDLIIPEAYLPLLDKIAIEQFNKYWSNYSQWNTNIITFNYTSSIEKLLQLEDKKQLKLGFSKYQNPVFLNNIKHIHGSILDRILLGVNDTSQIDNEVLCKNPTFLDILVKPQTNKMAKHLIDNECINLIRNTNLICLFGLSIGDTDKIWWELIGEQLKNDHCRIIYFTIGEKIENRRFHLIGDKERKLKEYLLSKTKLTNQEKNNLKDKIYIAYNTNMFKI